MRKVRLRTLGHRILHHPGEGRAALEPLLPVGTRRMVVAIAHVLQAATEFARAGEHGLKRGPSTINRHRA
jgi:hypothetical protein